MTICDFWGTKDTFKYSMAADKNQVRGYLEISTCSLSLQTERQNFSYLSAVSLIDITVEREFMLSLLSSCCLLRMDNGTP